MLWHHNKLCFFLSGAWQGEVFPPLHSPRIHPQAQDDRLCAKCLRLLCVADRTSCPPGSPQEWDRRAAPGGAGRICASRCGQSAPEPLKWGQQSRTSWWGRLASQTMDGKSRRNWKTVAQIWGARGIWEERECRVDRGREVAQGRTGWDNVETTLCLGATLLPEPPCEKKTESPASCSPQPEQHVLAVCCGGETQDLCTQEKPHSLTLHWTLTLSEVQLHILEVLSAILIANLGNFMLFWVLGNSA